MNINNTCIISCYFGYNLTNIYPAPNEYKCFFFTNNKLLYSLITKNKWIYIYIKCDLYINTYFGALQSKYIKFLQFLNNNSFNKLFKNYKYIIYIDHKFLLTNNNINDLIKENKNDILIRYTPITKSNIVKNLYTEFYFSLRQPRYNHNADKIKLLINELKNKNLLNPYKKVCNTGMMIYNIHNPNVLTLCKCVYNLIKKYKNPECQIFWSIAREPFENIIHCIDYNHIKIHHIVHRFKPNDFIKKSY